jgi:hypothetical protein
MCECMCVYEHATVPEQTRRFSSLGTHVCIFVRVYVYRRYVGAQDPGEDGRRYGGTFCGLESPLFDWRSN